MEVFLLKEQKNGNIKPQLLFPPWLSNWDQGQGNVLVIQKRALETFAQLVAWGGKSGRKLRSDRCSRSATEPRPALAQVLPALLVALLHRRHTQPLHQSTLQPVVPGRAGLGERPWDIPGEHGLCPRTTGQQGHRASRPKVK